MSLTVTHLWVSVDGKQILRDINLGIKPGKIHALMGPNGSGKSTLAQVLMGNPSYKIQNPNLLEKNSGQAKIQINGENIRDKAPDERAKMGLFLAFQNPVSVPGVSVANLLRSAYQAKKGEAKPKKASSNPALSVWKFNEHLVEKAKLLGIPQEFLKRGLNEDFSGGEKKKLEMLQAVMLSPKYTIFDEIDTGLDVDALKTVAKTIELLRQSGAGILIITHYQRILRFAKPDYVHILIDGEIAESGSHQLAHEVEKSGYKRWVK